MKKLALLLLCCFVAPAQGALLLYEPFAYPAEQRVLGQTNSSTGTPWRLASAAADTTAINVAAGSLATPATLDPAIGNSATITGIGNNSGASNRLAFDSTSTTITSGTVYYSMALRVDELTGSNNTVGGFFFGLNNTGDTATGSNPTAVAGRLQMRIDPTDPTKYNIGIFRNVAATAAATSWSGPLTPGDTHFLVGSYEIVPGATNDVARLWINPAPSTFADASFDPATTPPTLIDNSTGTGTDINIASIILRQSPAPYLTLDELRVGTAWASVTPIPEPSALALAGLVGLGLLHRRRR